MTLKRKATHAGLKKQSKEINQSTLFRQIWDERPHVSQVSGCPLPEAGSLQWHWCFSHVLPKGIYGKAKLSKENIILITPEEHTLWGNHVHKVRDRPEWKWVFELYEDLKEKYHRGYFK